MSKHKLYVPNLCSPFNLGLKRENFMTAPVAKKIMLEKHGSPEPKRESHPALLIKLENSKPGISRKSIFENEAFQIQEKEDESSDSTLASALKNDFDADDLYSKFNQKIPYTYQEDEIILKYVLKGQNIFRVSSLSLWKQLELKKNNPKRTYQSLKNRFLRNIKPNIFTTYKHLVQDSGTIEKILIKFPELKKQIGGKNLLRIKIPKLEMKPEEDITLSMRSNEFQSNVEHGTESLLSVTNGNLKLTDHLRPMSPLLQSHKTFNTKKTVTLRKNLIKISVDLNKSKDFEVSLPPSLGLNERFKKLRKSNERVPCPTCGRFYRRPVANDSSESDVESNILISGSVSISKNVNTISKNSDIVTNSNATSVRQKENLISQPSSNSSFSQKLLFTLEKSDKSDGDSDESNGAPENISRKEQDEVGVCEIVDIAGGFSEKTSEETSEDSDIHLIYENTVGRYQKLQNSDEKKLLQRYLQRNRNCIGLNTNWEQNLDSFFLDSETEIQTSALTNDDPSEIVSVSTQSRKITKSSLASNMKKMLAE